MRLQILPIKSIIIQRNTQVPVWKFSNDTLQNINKRLNLFNFHVDWKKFALMEINPDAINLFKACKCHFKFKAALGSFCKNNKASPASWRE
jgi:hypothetical protein